MKTIMVATDFSERSDRALRRATLLARQFGASSALIHVVDDDQPRRIVDSERDEAEQLLRRMAATLGDVDGVGCEARVILASPFAGIVKAVEEGPPIFWSSGLIAGMCSRTFLSAPPQSGLSDRWTAPFSW